MPPGRRPNPEPTQAIGQATNPAGRLRIGERAIVTHQRHLTGAILARRSIQEPTPKLAAAGGMAAMAKVTLYPHPAGKRSPLHADPDRVKRFPRHGFLAFVEENPKRYAVSVLIPIYGRSTRFGHEADLLIAARTGLEHPAY